MARVPTVSPSEQPVPTNPGYQRVPGLQRIEAPSAAFGAAQAESLQRSAGTLQDLSGNLAQRAIQDQEARNAVARARDLSAFTQKAQSSLEDMSTGQDMTDPGTIAAYGVQLNKDIGDIVASHTGGPESSAQLQARLELQRTQFLSHAQGLAATAKENLVNSTVTTQLQPITAAAYSNPGNIEDLMKRSDGVIADMAPGLGTNRATALTNQGRQEVIKSAIQGVLDRGDIEGAAKLTDQYAALMTPDVQRYFQSHITIARVQADKAKNMANQKIAEATAILGHPPTDADRKVLLGLVAPVNPNVKQPMTPAQMIAGFEKASGKPATPDQIAIAYGLERPPLTGGTFGNSLRGRALSIVDQNVVGFASGLLTPEQERLFTTSVNELQRPHPQMDPETGVIQYVTDPLPPAVVEAYQRRGVPLPSTTGQTVLPGQAGGQPAPAAGAPATAPAAGAPSPATGAPSPAPAAPAVASAAADAGIAPPPGGDTIWNLNQKSLITGPGPALGEEVHRFPAVGGLLPGAQDTQARTYVELAQRRLVQALQTNKNFPVKEMQSIEKDIDLSPALYDNKEAYQARLIGVDDVLAKLEQQALKQSDPASGLPLGARQQARVTANLIHNFRNIMGVPPKLTPEQARTLPVGSAFRTNTGEVRYVTKPAAPKAANAGSDELAKPVEVPIPQAGG